MRQDLRELFRRERETHKFELKKDHEARFMERLDNALPKKKANFKWLKIAASILVLLSLGTIVSKGIYKEDSLPAVVDENTKDEKNNNFSFGDLSPELKKVEDYYMANINMELSQLNISKENKNLVDGYMERLSELDKEYKNLNKELNELGPNDQTISALIENLQMRLQLLQQLKKKLNQLKQSKNEQII